MFADGTHEPFDAIVAATGFAPRLEEIAPGLELDELGWPRKSGHEVAPGLYVCGFYVSPTGMLRDMGIEAQRIAELVWRKTSA